MKIRIIETVISVLRIAVVGTLISPAFAMEVQDYGIEIRDVESIRWIDNDRLALVGLVHVPDRAITQYSGQRIGKLVILDTRTGKADWHEEFSGRFCYDGSRFRLSSIDDTYHPDKNSHEYRFWIMSGVPGKLVRKEVSREYLNNFDFTMACKGADERQLPSWFEDAKKSGRLFKPLKAEHGWVEIFVGDPNYSHQSTYPLAIYHPSKDGKPIPIGESVFQPWLDKGYHVRLVRYEAFKNAYLLALDDTSDRGREGGSFWWLYPDGNTEQILVYGRRGYWEGVRFNGVIPAKNELLAFSADTRPRSDKSGLYRQVASGELELVVRGRVSEKTLSPNGCKLAFGLDPKGFPNERYRLHVMSVCESSVR